MPLLCSKRVDIEEWIDRPETTVEEIRQSLLDQELVNRVLGGGEATWAHALPLLERAEADPVRVLDAACGGGDISRRIIDDARRLGRRIEVAALDLNEKTIACARQFSQGYPEMLFVVGDALRPPFADRTFDIVILATFLHHLSPDGVVHVLRAMGRLSRGHVIAADLVRSSLAHIGIRLFARFSGFGPVSVHDGAVSVCRAYTPAELAELAKRAGLRDRRIHRHRLYRMTLVYRGYE